MPGGNDQEQQSPWDALRIIRPYIPDDQTQTGAPGAQPKAGTSSEAPQVNLKAFIPPSAADAAHVAPTLAGVVKPKAVAQTLVGMAQQTMQEEHINSVYRDRAKQAFSGTDASDADIDNYAKRLRAGSEQQYNNHIDQQVKSLDDKYFKSLTDHEQQKRKALATDGDGKRAFDFSSMEDEHGNILPEYKKQIVQMTGGDPHKFKEAAGILMDQKVRDYELAPTIMQNAVQGYLDWTHKNAYPAYLASVFGIGLTKAAANTGAVLGYGVSSAAENAFGDGDASAREHLARWMQDSNHIPTSASGTEGDGALDNLRTNPIAFLDAALTGTAKMAGDIEGGAPIARGIGGLVEGKTFSGAVKGLTAANSTANKSYAVLSTVMKGLDKSRIPAYMDNLVSMGAGFGPQMYANYYSDLLQKGYSTEEAAAKAAQRVGVSTFALSVFNPFVTPGTAMSEVPGQILKGGVERTAAQSFTGKMKEIASRALNKDLAKHAAVGGLGMMNGAVADAVQDHYDAIQRGDLPENAPFDWSDVFKKAGESFITGALTMTLHGISQGHGVLPKDFQAHATAQAATDPEGFKTAVTNQVNKGRMTPQEGQQLLGFVDRIAPVVKEATTPAMTMQQAKAAGLTGRDLMQATSPAMDQVTAAKYAIEGERLKETARAIQDLSNQTTTDTKVGADGKKHEVTLGLDPATGTFTEDAGKQISDQVKDLQDKAAQSARAIQMLREGTHMAGRTVSGKEMMELAGRYSPDDGLRAGQALDITENGPYRTEVQDITRHSDNPEVSKLVAQMKIPARPESGNEGSDAPSADAVEPLRFEPKNTNPPVLAADGRIIDGKKRIAYALANGAKELEVARPVELKDAARQIADEHEATLGTDSPDPVGLSPEHQKVLDGARAAYDGQMEANRKPNKAERAAGVTNKATRAYYAAAAHVHDQGMSRDQALDILQRVANGSISAPLAESIYNHVAKTVAEGKPLPIATPDAAVQAPSAEAPDPVLASSPYWDADGGKFKPGFAPGEAGWDEVQKWLDDHQAKNAPRETDTLAGDESKGSAATEAAGTTGPAAEPDTAAAPAEGTGGQQLGGERSAELPGSVPEVKPYRLGRAIIQASPEVLKEAGWAQKSIKALHARMLEMFGTDRAGREISLVVVDNASAADYWKDKTAAFDDPGTAPDAWVSADRKTVYINAEKATPSTAIHELGHVWTAWAEQKATAIHALGEKLAKESSEFKYMQALLAGETPVTPEGMSEEEAKRWERYAFAYEGRPNADEVMADEVMAHAIQNQGKMLAGVEDAAREAKGTAAVDKKEVERRRQEELAPHIKTLNWFSELAKIDPLDQSKENAEKAGQLRGSMPKGLSAIDFNTLLAYRGNYSESIQYKHAVSRSAEINAKYDAELKGGGKAKLKRGKWNEWLDALWTAVKDAAGFRKLSVRDAQKLTIDEFAKAAAEEIASGKKLTRKFKEALDADEAPKTKEQKKAEAIDPALADQVEGARRKPRIIAGEDGEAASAEAAPSAAAMRAVSEVQAADIMPHIEAQYPELYKDLLEAVTKTSHYQDNLAEIPSDRRAEAALLDIIADPTLLKTKEDIAALGGFTKTGNRSTAKLSGKIRQVYDIVGDLIEKATGETIDPDRLARQMSSADQDRREALGIKPWETVDRKGKLVEKAKPAPAVATPTPRPLSEERQQKLTDLLDLFHLPGAKSGGDTNSAEDIKIERNKIELSAKEKGIWLKAPNGKDSNLDEEQWVSVRTRRFKAWFGDWERRDMYSHSQMVDENGEPKLFHHRTNGDFNTFDLNHHGSATDAGWLGEGFYFYGEKEEAYGYGNREIQAYLNIRNPYYAESEDNLRLSEANDVETSREFTDQLKGEDYDGVYFDGDYRQETVAFYPEQIKSATSNVGTYSPEIGDIRYHLPENRESQPQVDKALDARRLSAAMNFVASSISEGRSGLADILTDVYGTIGEKTDIIYPHIKKAYLAYMSEAPDEMLGDMDSVSGVRSFNYQDFKNLISNAPNTEPGLEPNSPRAGSEDGMGQANVHSEERPGPERRPGLGSGEAGQPGDRQPESPERVPADHATADGERSGDRILRGTPGREHVPERDAGSDNARGSGWYSVGRVSPERDGGSAAADFASESDAGRYADKLAEQVKAEGTEVIPADAKNIAETLPFLMPSQHEDIAFAERRFLKPEGYGVLFANGTGTGKTLTGGGVIKRAIKSGLTEGLIVVPNQEVMNAWTNDLKFLGIKVTPLDGTQDAGQGVAITTYANFGANNAITNRQHDWVVCDEAHNLMSSGDATITSRLRALRAITGHPDGVNELTERRYPELHTELLRLRDSGPEAAFDSKYKEWQDVLSKTAIEVADRQGDKRTRTLFLSATPFAYRENVQWGEGYLFDYPKVTRTGYNSPGPYEAFMIQHFGYRMRYNKLTEPEAGVNTDYMERSFNDYLHKQGAMSTRALDLDSDYQRSFVLTPNKVGAKIDEGMKFLQENDYFHPLYDLVRHNFNYLTSARLLEAIKAKESVPLIRKLTSEGKKVVVFYNYNEGGGFSPFRFEQWDINMDGYVPVKNGNDVRDIPLREMARQFYEARPDLANLDFKGYGSPLETLRKEFPDAVVVNGREARSSRTNAIKNFNVDGSPNNVLLVNGSIDAGWSAHDKTGGHERVIINLGLPVKPTQAIQQEGRIYRVGQHPESNSRFMYLNTGTSWERNAFASKIAERASTAENLAMGSRARRLKQSFVEGFEESAPFSPETVTGTGGKARDRENINIDDPWAKAKSYYYANQKKTSQTKAAEGVDYFATPEPLGLKMVQWADIKPGEKALDPSSGHGTIARWFPDYVNATMIEPSAELISKAGLANTDAKKIHGTFEDHHIANKYDGIVMNPPYGQAGKMALEHVQKSARQLEPGGRIVAIVPVGAFDGKFEKWFYAKDEKGRPANPELHLVSRILLPSATFGRAGTGVNTQVLVIDRAPQEGVVSTEPTQNIDLRGRESINDLFDGLEHLELPGRPEKVAETPSEPAPGPAGTDPLLKEAVKARHTKNDTDIYVVQPSRRMEYADYKRVETQAKKNGGYYSKFKGNGAVPGFIFPTAEAAEAFRSRVNGSVADGGEAYHLPANATNEQKELARQIDEALEEKRKARAALEAKRKELNKGLQDDSADLFGTRRSTASAGNALFDVRADSGAAADQLKPYEARVKTAEAEAARLYKLAQDFENKPSAQTELFSLPHRAAADARRDIDDGSDMGTKLSEVLNETETDGTPAALAARGELFAFPFSKSTRADMILDEHKAYFNKEDDWLGNRDIATVEAANTARRFQEDIQKTVGPKPSVLHPIDRSSWKQNWRNVDRAIHVYLDAKRNPDHIAMYQDALAEAKTTLRNPSASGEEIAKAKNIVAQEKVVELSQNLTDAQKKVADDIDQEYKRIGEASKDAGLIKDTLENYVARAWDFGAGSTEEYAKFATSTRHSMMRSLDTILEGYAKGYKLKIEGATNNLAILHREITNVIENRSLLEQGLKIKDSEGLPLLSTFKRAGYERIEAPSFRKWNYEGKLSDYTSADRRMFGNDVMVTENGSVVRKREVFAPKEIARGLNNILGRTSLDGSKLQGLTRFNQAVKQSILSYSGFHYIAFTRAHFLSTGKWNRLPVNPVTAYKAGLNMISEMHPLLEKVIRNGMTLNRQQDFNEGVIAHSTWLGEKIDKMGGFPAHARETMVEWNKQFHKHLFETYGAGLKAFDAISMMQHEMSRSSNRGKSADEIAATVAKVMNDTYGGLNWNRMRGNAFQNPTVRHISSLLLLAPDWTASNLRFARGAFKSGMEGEIYRRMWGKVVLRGVLLTAFANAALACMDEQDDDGSPISWVDAMGRRYKKGWEAGHLRWLMVDITPMYHAMGGDEGKRSYFSIFGAYTDPIKMMGISHSKDGGVRFGMQDFLEAKASFTTKAALESFTGENWQHRQFTTVDEMLGIDDKGAYEKEQIAHKAGDLSPHTGKPYAKTVGGHHKGDPKGGKDAGHLVRMPDMAGAPSVWKAPAMIPSYVLSQVRGMLPTSLQALSAASTGENDWAQFAMQAPGTGVVTSKDPDAK